ncbi:MAG: hypothetical protein NVSMB13_07950 [Mycobacteriales bacterium]
MPGSVVLDTAIGLVFVFLTASLVCTGALEWVANRLNKRGEYLLRGLREMLDLPPATPEAPDSVGTVVPGPHKQGLAVRKNRRTALQTLSTQGNTFRDNLGAGSETPYRPEARLADLVLAHPLVAVMHRPDRPGRTSGGMKLASYLSASTFAAALIDLLVPDGAGNTSIAVLQKRVARLDPRVPARDALLALLRDAGTDVEAFRHRLEDWYDEQMGRVSGWYRRWAQWRLLIAGLLLALVVNVDTLSVARVLYRDQPVRAAVVAQAVADQGCPSAAGSPREACLAAQQGVLRALPLPLGWGLRDGARACRDYSAGARCARPDRWVPFLWHSAIADGFGGAGLKLLGWLITGLAVSLGAPFWFDALSKLGSLRTAGRRPLDGASGRASVAGR